MSYENYAPPRSAVEGSAGETGGAQAPPLWIPSTTANICLVFPIALGAWLQQQNWKAMGRPVEARRAGIWMIADLVFLAAWLVVPRFDLAIAGLLWPLSFAMLIAWYYSSAKPQYVYVKKTYGKDYPRRSFGIPLLIGIATWQWFLSNARCEQPGRGSFAGAGLLHSGRWSRSLLSRR